MIKYYDGTVFNVGTDAIVNTVNCVGFMGAGLALEFKLRYPKMYSDYYDKCNKNKIVTGKIDYYIESNSLTIVNFPTKFHFKYPSKIEWIENGLIDFKNSYRQYKIKSIAFPKLGTSNGGLDWNVVNKLIVKYLADLEIDVYICLDTNNLAEGIEEQMLNKFNSYSVYQLSEITKLNKNQIKALEFNMPYSRFWLINQTETIGVKTYENLFKYFYRIVTNQIEENLQTSLL